MTNAGFAVVDVETTGLFPHRGDRVIELGVVLLAPDGQHLSEWSTLLNPGGSVTGTKIHGLSTADVRHAPSFAEVLGELNALLMGRVLVGHNLPFDREFLEMEYARAGWSLPDGPYLCTLEASHIYLPTLSRRKLAHCCELAGATLENAHSALADAKATAELLRYYLNPAVSPAPVSEHLQLPQLAQEVSWPTIPVNAAVRTLVRSHTPNTAVAASPGRLSQLLSELRRTPSAQKQSKGAAGYFELVVRAFEDGILTEEECQELASFAQRYALSRLETSAIHRDFALSLAQKAVADGKVSRDERQQLISACEALGLPTSEVKDLLSDAKALNASQRAHDCRPLPTDWAHGEPLRIGDGVAFTGCDDMQRAQLEGRAQANGLRVTGAVSKKTTVLITDGVDKTTGKAKKAAEYGTRIVSPEVFAYLVEYVQPAQN